MENTYFWDSPLWIWTTTTKTSAKSRRPWAVSRCPHPSPGESHYLALRHSGRSGPWAFLFGLWSVGTQLVIQVSLPLRYKSCWDQYWQSRGGKQIRKLQMTDWGHCMRLSFQERLSKASPPPGCLPGPQLTVVFLHGTSMSFLHEIKCSLNHRQSWRGSQDIKTVVPRWLPTRT